MNQSFFFSSWDTAYEVVLMYKPRIYCIPNIPPSLTKPKVLTVWIELWHALNIWCSQCLTVKATRISHQGWLALTRPTIGFCCGNWSLALETFWQWLPLMYDPGMILQVLNCSLKCQIPWVTAHGIWGIAPLGLKPPGNHAGPRICPLSGQDVLWTRSCGFGWSLLSTWAVFPQTVCPQWGVLTVGAKAGAWSGCSLWSRAFSCKFP